MRGLCARSAFRIRVEVTYRDGVAVFVAKDGSEIRELMHPRSSSTARQQSLAEAIVPPGARTTLHRHVRSEEFYHILAGEGVMTLGERSFPVARGATIAIPPGTPHCISNEAGRLPLVLLCCCAPAYADDDTQLLE